MSFHVIPTDGDGSIRLICVCRSLISSRRPPAQYNRFLEEIGFIARMGTAFVLQILEHAQLKCHALTRMLAGYDEV